MVIINFLENKKVYCTRFIIYASILSYMLSLVSSPVALAVSPFIKENAYVYNPNSIDSCVIGSSTTGGSSIFGDGSAVPTTGVVDYKNKPIFTADKLALIAKHKPFYMAAAQKEGGFPWEMLAVIHYRETGLSRTNHRNGQGLYQDFEKKGGPYPAGVTVDDAEFQRQTDFAAKIITQKAGSRGNELKLGTDVAVKHTFFGYNGRAGVYIKQAMNMGFSAAEAGWGEGSPYVMNIADSKRDPAVNRTTWGQIKRDRGPIEYPANKDHGAFVMYAALRGGITSNGVGSNENIPGAIASECAGEGYAGTSGGTSSSVSGVLQDGGLSLDQAKALVMNYGANKNRSTQKSMDPDKWQSCQGGGANCVSFVQFFLNKFTGYNSSGTMGNGDSVVKNMRAKGVPTGNTPKVYSVFSWGGGTYGHTGVVLGIHGDKLIVGHASCSSGSRGRGNGTTLGSGAAIVRVGTVDQKSIWLGKTPTGFAYPADIKTDVISSYLTNGE